MKLPNTSKLAVLHEQREREYAERPTFFRSEDTGRSQFIVENFKDVNIKLDSNDLVENRISPGSFVLFVGKSNVGKTNATLDLCFSVARGVPWMGHAVDQGGVFYAALEGGVGILKRVVAYRKFHKLENKQIPFTLARGTVNLRNPSETTAFIDEVRKVEQSSGKIKLIVIDTLNRALSGDENSSADAGDFIKSVDHIRQETGAAVLVVHHLGKQDTRGSRGHSLIPAAADTELTLEADKNGVRLIKTTKQRDFEFEPPIGFDLQTVELGVSTSGKPISSCVVVPTNMFVVEEDSAPKLNLVPARALEVLKALAGDSQKPVSASQWRQTFHDKHYKNKARSTKHEAFKAATEALLAVGIVKIKGDSVWLI